MCESAKSKYVWEKVEPTILRVRNKASLVVREGMSFRRVRDIFTPLGTVDRTVYPYWEAVFDQIADDLTEAQNVRTI